MDQARNAQWPTCPAGTVRSAQREGCLRYRLHCQHQRRAVARDHHQRHSDPHQSHASRRVRLRSGNRRWRGHSDSDSRTSSSAANARSLDSPCRRLASTASEWCSCRWSITQRLVCEGILERICRRRRADGSRLARHADQRRMRSAAWRARASLISSRFSCAARPGWIRTTFERKLYVVMKRAENEVLASSESRRQELLLHSVALFAHDRL